MATHRQIALDPDKHLQSVYRHSKTLEVIDASNVTSAVGTLVRSISDEMKPGRLKALQGAAYRWATENPGGDLRGFLDDCQQRLRMVAEPQNRLIDQRQVLEDSVGDANPPVQHRDPQQAGGSDADNDR